MVECTPEKKKELLGRGGGLNATWEETQLEKGPPVAVEEEKKAGKTESVRVDQRMFAHAAEKRGKTIRKKKKEHKTN